MFRNIRLTKAFVFVLMASLVIINTSCDKENIDERPELPPIESLVMDFDDFQDNPSILKSIPSSYTNFVHAYLNVTFWNAFTTGSLFVPVTSYAYALQQDPEYVGDSTWEWKYDFTLLQEDFTATLTGKRLDNETFSMEMNIAKKSLPAVKFTYYDGVIRYDHTHAAWNMYKNNITSSVKVLEVEWNKDFVAGDASLKYTYVEPGMDETNSSILWEYIPLADYDAAYTINLTTGTINIEWELSTKAGRVKDPVYFEDTSWHCWNDILTDIDCN